MVDVVPIKKKRVNLYLDEALVNNAKELGINISKAASDALSALPEAKEGESIEDAYKKLFDKIQPILKVYNITVQIGNIESTTPEGRIPDFGTVCLDKNEASFYTEYITSNPSKAEVKGAKFAGSDGFVTNFIIKNVFEFNDENKYSSLYLSFYPPGRILSTLLQAIAEKKKKNKEKSLEIEKVCRIINAIEPQLLGKETKG